MNRVKKSIVKVIGVGSHFNTLQPYLVDTDYESGGTGFFVDHALFGKHFPHFTNRRYLLTNFHVVENFNSKQCNIEFPERAGSFLCAQVAFVVPKIDVAILEIDPFKKHHQWWADDQAEFLESIPNLQVESSMIKGTSQKVRAIGFPNLCDDRQISDGTLCGRGCGMLQLDISINSGNSGGPLFVTSSHKVIGINTASIQDSERISLAIPISMVKNFFHKWTDFRSTILFTPSYGFQYKTLTKDYLEYKQIDKSFEGAVLKSIIKGSAADRAGLKENDILLGLEDENNRYNISCQGKIKTSYCDALVSLDDVEFLLHLQGDIKFTILRGKLKQMTLKVVPTPIQFRVRKQYPSYEHIPYCFIGGCVFQELSLNMLQQEEDEEDETNINDNVTPLLNDLRETIGMKTMVICTYITPQSHVTLDNTFQEYDCIQKINDVEITSIRTLNNVLDTVCEAFHKGRTKFLKITTKTDTHVFSLERLQTQEIKDALRYPSQLLRLLPQEQTAVKRKRRKREFLTI